MRYFVGFTQSFNEWMVSIQLVYLKCNIYYVVANYDEVYDFYTYWYMKNSYSEFIQFYSIVGNFHQNFYRHNNLQAAMEGVWYDLGGIERIFTHCPNKGVTCVSWGFEVSVTKDDPRFPWQPIAPIFLGI